MHGPTNWSIQYLRMFTYTYQTRHAVHQQLVHFCSLLYSYVCYVYLYKICFIILICTCIELGRGDYAAIGLGTLLFIALAIIWMLIGLTAVYIAHQYV